MSEDPYYEFELQFKEFLGPGPVGESIAPFLAQQLREIECIDISGNNSLKYRFTDDVILGLVKCLLQCRINIQCLTLKHHRLTSTSVKHISALWQVENSQLCQLDFEGNDIDERGVEVIAQWLLYSNCTLLSLNLSNNSIHEEGGMILSDAVKLNSTLQRLLLNNCDLNLKAVIAIITCTSGNVNSNIGHLDLGTPILKNFRNDEICDHISSRLLLSPHSRLQILDLQKCSITDQGATLLTQALMFNNIIKSLNLEW